MDKTFVIKAAVKSRFIDLAVTAGAAGNISCEEYYANKKGRKSLDISFIKDDRVAETVVCAVYDHFKRCKIPHSSLPGINQGFVRLFETIPGMFQLDFPEFCSAIANVVLPDKPVPMNTAKGIISKCCMNIACNGDMFACDYWDLRKIAMSPDRRNPAAPHNTISFSKVKNESNKQLLKKYIKHLLLETHESVSTIICKQMRLRTLLNRIEKPFVAWGQDDMENLIMSIRFSFKKRLSVATYILLLEQFAQYFVEKDIIPENIVRQFHSLTLGCGYEFRETNRDTYVIAQIFNVLDKVSNPYAVIWFLLIFTTGMRKSEASAMRRDCLESDEKGRHYVRFYNQKMKKDVTNRIPDGLHDMMSRHISSLPEDCLYLFPSCRKQGHPICSNSLSDILKREFIRLGVKNADGTPYVFKAHDLRHWIAKRMYEEEIPTQFIQEQLHHAAPEMTMAYVEFQDKAKAAKMKQYMSENREGIEQHTVFSDKDYAEYAQKKMSLRALPNGMCARPKVLGRCSTMDSCLKCPDFRTEPKDLLKHREHLKNLNAFIDAAEKYGWKEQADESREIRARLLKIIRDLEMMEETHG